MTLDEAIKHYEEVAEENEKNAKSINNIYIKSCLEYAKEQRQLADAKEQRQLAEWLRKLKAYEEAREEIELKMDKCQYSEIRFGMRNALYIQEKYLKEVNADGDSD